MSVGGRATPTLDARRSPAGVSERAAARLFTGTRRTGASRFTADPRLVADVAATPGAAFSRARLRAADAGTADMERCPEGPAVYIYGDFCVRGASSPQRPLHIPRAVSSAAASTSGCTPACSLGSGRKALHALPHSAVGAFLLFPWTPSPPTRRCADRSGAALLALVALPPVAEAAGRDSDGDNLSDRYERTVSHTNPRRDDTDNDGLRDRYEMRRSKSSPLKSDTDGDGLTDRYEWRRSQTNPRVRDTDKDELTDRQELVPVGVPDGRSRAALRAPTSRPRRRRPTRVAATPTATGSPTATRSASRSRTRSCGTPRATGSGTARKS